MWVWLSTRTDNQLPLYVGVAYGMQLFCDTIKSSAVCLLANFRNGKAVKSISHNYNMAQTPRPAVTEQQGVLTGPSW